MTDAYLTLAELAEYSRISVRQLRRFLALPPAQALPCYRPGRRVLVVRRDEFDVWIQQHRRRGNAIITRVMQELGQDPLRELRKPAARIAGRRPPDARSTRAPRSITVDSGKARHAG